MEILFIIGYKHPNHPFFTQKSIQGTSKFYRDYLYSMCIQMGQTLRKKRVLELMDNVRTFKELSFQKEDFKMLNNLVGINVVIFENFLRLIPNLLNVFSSIPTINGFIQLTRVENQRNREQRQSSEAEIEVKFFETFFENCDPNWGSGNLNFNSKVTTLLEIVRSYLLPTYKARYKLRKAEIIDFETHKNLIKFYSELFNLQPKITLSTIKKIETSLFMFLDFTTHTNNKISFGNYDKLTPIQYFSFVNFSSRRLTNNSSKIDSFCSNNDNLDDLSQEFAKLLSSKSLYLNRIDPVQNNKNIRIGSDVEQLNLKRFTFIKNLYNCKVQNIMEALSGTWKMEIYRILPPIQKLLKDEPVMGKLKKSDVITYAFCLATIQNFGSFQDVSKHVRNGPGSKYPTVKFSRTVSIMSKKFTTRALFKVDWGREEFLAWIEEEFKGRFNFIYLVLFLIDLLLSKKNQMSMKMSDENIEKYTSLVNEYFQKFVKTGN